MPISPSILALILKSLAQPTRLKIVQFLRNGERCVCEIFPAIGEEQSNTSRHLAYMQSHGILTRRKEGVKIFYALKHPEALAIIDLAANMAIREGGKRSETLASGKVD